VVEAATTGNIADSLTHLGEHLPAGTLKFTFE